MGNKKTHNSFPMISIRAGEPEPEPLEEKRGAGAAWKKSQEIYCDFKDLKIEEKKLQGEKAVYFLKDFFFNLFSSLFSILSTPNSKYSNFVCYTFNPMEI